MKKVFLLLLLFPLFAVSCKNFLKGEEVSKQMRKSIEYANAPEIEIKVLADKTEYGTVVSGNSIKCKATDEKAISFKVADNYQFLRWEVIYSDTKKPVEVNNKIIQIYDDKALETSFLLKKAVNNLQIRPVCIEKTAVENCIPKDDGLINPKDTSIYITFNKALSDNCNFDEIKIYSDEMPVKNHYIISFQEKTLIFTPDSENFITFGNQANKIIEVVIPETFFCVENDIEVPLNTKFSSSFKINNKTRAELDENPPKIKVEKLYRTQEDQNTRAKEINPVNKIDFDNFLGEAEKIKSIVVKDKVYLTISGQDDDSGIEKLDIKEYTVLDSKGNKIDSLVFDSQAKNESIPYNSGNDYEYILHSEDGLIKLELFFTDKMGNTSDVQTVYVVKDTYVLLYKKTYVKDGNEITEAPEVVNDYSAHYLDALHVRNDLDPKTNPFDYITHKDFVLGDEYNTKLEFKNFKDVICSYGTECIVSEMEDLKFEIKYGYDIDNLNNFAEISKDDYKCSIENIDFTKNLYISVKVEDLMGNDIEFTNYIMKKTKCFGIKNGYPIFDDIENSSIGNAGIVIKSGDELQFSSYMSSDKEITELYVSNMMSGNVLSLRSPFAKVYKKPETTTIQDLSNSYLSDLEIVNRSADLCITCTIKNYDSNKDYYILNNLYRKAFKLTTVDDNGEIKGNVTLPYNSTKEDGIISFVYKDKNNSLSLYTGIIENQTEKEEDSGWYYITVPEPDPTKDLATPIRYYPMDIAPYGSTGSGFSVHMKDEASGIKETKKDSGIVKGEYFWVPVSQYDTSNDKEALLASYSEKSLYAYGQYNSEDKTTSLECNYKDLKENIEYYLFVKLYDNNGNCYYDKLLSSVTPHIIQERLSVSKNDKNFVFDTASVGNGISRQFSYKCWTEFDVEKEIWKTEETRYNNDIIPTNPCYIRAIYEIQNWDDDFYNIIYQTVPTYYYTGDQTCIVKNMIDGIGGITIYSDAPCLYYICSSSIGYGNDLQKWQFFGQQISPKQTSSNVQVDVSQVPDGDYYIVVAHFADGTILKSDVHQKNN